MTETYSPELLSQVRAIMTTTMERWNHLAEALPGDLLARKPAPGQWSALECLQHLIDTEHVFQFRLEAFLLDRPEFPAFNPDQEGTQANTQSTPTGQTAEFARLRQATLQSLEQVTPADLSRQSQHQELGPVTLGEMVNEWAAHDLNHTVQAERAIMQPYIQDCGPWKKFFTDHLIQG
jgi:hypothetical protein